MNTAAMETTRIFCWIILVIGVIIAIKNGNTYRNHKKIVDAIFAYKLWCLNHGDYAAMQRVDYEHEESYERTLFRLWDWGYKRILPPDKLELIKPFIKE